MERKVVNASRGYEVVCCSGLSVDLMINVAMDLEIEIQVRFADCDANYRGVFSSDWATGQNDR